MAPASARFRPRKNKKDGRASYPTWGWPLEEDGDWIPVPRVFLYLNKWADETGVDIQPRELSLLLVLQAQRFENKPIRRFWEELSWDMGCSKETVRKTAYGLRDKGLLKLKHHRGRAPDGKIGSRNDRNEFDLTPLLEKLERFKVKYRPKKKAGGDNNE